DESGGGCLAKLCECTSFIEPWCVACGADSGSDHIGDCPMRSPVTAAVELLVSAPRPLDDHTQCGEQGCAHILVKHDDNEGECLVKTGTCMRFQIVCADCSA